jgi:hypothetical protein
VPRRRDEPNDGPPLLVAPAADHYALASLALRIAVLLGWTDEPRHPGPHGPPLETGSCARSTRGGSVSFAGIGYQVGNRYAAMALTTCSASLPTPRKDPDDIAYRKNRPTKYKPGSLSTIPTVVRWLSSLAFGTGRSINEKSGLSPVHQMTLATSRTPSPSSSGRLDLPPGRSQRRHLGGLAGDQLRQAPWWAPGRRPPARTDDADLGRRGAHQDRPSDQRQGGQEQARREGELNVAPAAVYDVDSGARVATLDGYPAPRFEVVFSRTDRASLRDRRTAQYGCSMQHRVNR